ncbi:MAG: hypothetical protein ACR2MK_08195 [Solirubrobacteraceae bacterium]
MTVVGVIRAVWGAALLLAPGAAWRLAGSGDPDPAARLLTRVLGGRELVQAIVAARHCSRFSTFAGVAVDATHASTMLAVATARPADRRPATASALAAGSFAIAGLWAGRNLTAGGSAPRC